MKHSSLVIGETRPIDANTISYQQSASMQETKQPWECRNLWIYELKTWNKYTLGIWKWAIQKAYVAWKWDIMWNSQVTKQHVLIWTCRTFLKTTSKGETLKNVTFYSFIYLLLLLFNAFNFTHLDCNASATKIVTL